MVHSFDTNTKAATFYDAEKYEKLLFCHWWFVRCFSRRFCHGNVLIINKYIYVYTHKVYC